MTNINTDRKYKYINTDRREKVDNTLERSSESVQLAFIVLSTFFQAALQKKIHQFFLIQNHQKIAFFHEKNKCNCCRIK